jgi:hypothetical protein
MSATQIDQKMDEARKALDACGKAGDLFTIRKFLDLTVKKAGELDQELEKLDPINVDDAKLIQQIKDVTIKDLSARAHEADKFLKQSAEKK